MKNKDAAQLMCPVLSTPLIGDNHQFDSGDLFRAYCETGNCMFWETTKLTKEASTVKCHRCHKEVSLNRSTCSHCDAFIKGFGAKIPQVELKHPDQEGHCLLIKQ